ncbi:MAG: tyrosine-type recombinase/integrase [Candidatus Micrarchaeota archaeon]
MNMKDMVYLSDWDAQRERKMKQLDARDVELVRSFIDQKKAEGNSSKRLHKLVSVVAAWRRFLPDKSWKDFTKQDFVDAVLKLKQWKYKPNTVSDNLKIAKLFHKFVTGSKHPEASDWIKTGIPPNNEKPAEEILDEDDLRKLLDATPDLMMRCYLEILFLAGFRVGEGIRIRCGDVSWEKNGAARIAVSGGKGSRKVLVISPYLKKWWEMHPTRGDKNTYLFFNKNDASRPICYECIRKRLNKYAALAGITRKHNQYWFRHSSVSGKLLRDGWSAGESASYHGHSIATSERYFHRNGNAADNAVLRSQASIKEKVCRSCGIKNSDDAKRCTGCDALLDVRYAKEEEEQKKFVIELLVGMLKDESKRKELLSTLEKEINVLEAP